MKIATATVSEDVTMQLEDPVLSGASAVPTSEVPTAAMLILLMLNITEYKDL
jgi:hypothetical protein